MHLWQLQGHPRTPHRQHIGDNLLQRRCLWRTHTSIGGPVSDSSRDQTIIPTSKGRQTTGQRPPSFPEWVQNPKLPAFLLHTVPSGSSKGSPSPPLKPPLMAHMAGSSTCRNGIVMMMSLPTIIQTVTKRGAPQTGISNPTRNSHSYITQ